jgi:regulator of protease activity HflC (stomatin/prohibitin superfamily)
MDTKTVTPEVPIRPTSGWPVLFTWLVAAPLYVAFLVVRNPLFAIGLPLFVLVLPGFYVVEPNLARVLVLFGKYKGTVREDGFFWTNPFTMKKKVSLRAHNFDSKTIKVNDLLGNPVEISAVLVWRIHDTARATFDVQNFEHYVEVQSDAAVRQLATTYPYDDLESEGAEVTLRGNHEVIAEKLREMLSGRMESAGIEVIEARFNHLAYAPEIASAMLQRQQAKAIIAARQLIVDGAVGMVEMALERLRREKVLELDDERKATLVGNLLVVLCGNITPTPVINTGSLYT